MPSLKGTYCLQSNLGSDVYTQAAFILFSDFVSDVSFLRLHIHFQGPKLLPKFQVKSFLTPCSSLETPMDFHLYKSVMIGLMDLLGARLYFSSKVLTPYCYTIGK